MRVKPEYFAGKEKAANTNNIIDNVAKAPAPTATPTPTPETPAPAPTPVAETPAPKPEPKPAATTASKKEEPKPAETTPTVGTEAPKEEAKPATPDEGVLFGLGLYAVIGIGAGILVLLVGIIVGCYFFCKKFRENPYDNKPTKVIQLAGEDTSALDHQ